MSDLRSWLDPLLGQGAVLQVGEPVDPYAYECAAVLKHLDNQRVRVPTVFESPRSLDGGEHPYKLIFNLYGDPRYIAAALGDPSLTWTGMLDAFAARMSDDVPVVRSENPPVQAVVESGDDVDLRRLPWVRHVDMEGGPYFTPNIVSRGPSGRYNVSWNRCMYLDPQHIAIHMSPRHLWSYQQAAEADGEPLPVALVCGHNPLFQQAAATLVSTDRDEYEAAGGLMGEPLAVAPSAAFGEQLLIPADAELVIEGEILPGKRTLEGPFGEYLQYLGPEKISHVVRVRAVTRRKDPYITEIFAAHADHLRACISLEASFLHAARKAVPSVVSTSWFQGGGPTTLVICLKKISEGLPMRAAMAAMAASNMLKQVIVVDDDIDPEDPADVMWAVSTRTTAEQDITIVKGIQGSLLDPSLGDSLLTSGFIIDATKPLDRPYPARAKVPDHALDRFPLRQYVGSEELADLDRRVSDVFSAGERV